VRASSAAAPHLYTSARLFSAAATCASLLSKPRRASRKASRKYRSASSSLPWQQVDVSADAQASDRAKRARLVHAVAPDVGEHAPLGGRVRRTGLASSGSRVCRRRLARGRPHGRPGGSCSQQCHQRALQNRTTVRLLGARVEPREPCMRARGDANPLQGSDCTPHACSLRHASDVKQRRRASDELGARARGWTSHFD